jgi:hypothetical protein
MLVWDAAPRRAAGPVPAPRCLTGLRAPPAPYRLSNHKDDPLLAYKAGGGAQGGGGGGASAASGGAAGSRYSVQLRLEGGTALLPDLTVTDSSEALLQGRRPPFRLLVWAPDGLGGFDHSVQYAVSDDFVVATRRVKQANKADIPMINDHVSKIEHIGGRVQGCGRRAQQGGAGARQRRAEAAAGAGVLLGAVDGATGCGRGLQDGLPGDAQPLPSSSPVAPRPSNLPRRRAAFARLGVSHTLSAPSAHAPGAPPPLPPCPGRETVKKLSDMRVAAQESGVDMQIDERMARIETGGRADGVC